MITLKIVNWFQKDSEGADREGPLYYVNDYEPDFIAPYDEEKWKDEKTYEFETLKDLHYFCETCDIKFADRVHKLENEWNWYELSFDIYIDESEDNLMIFDISMCENWSN